MINDKVKYYPILNNGFEKSINQKGDVGWDFWVNGVRYEITSEEYKTGKSCMKFYGKSKDPSMAMWQVIPVKNVKVRKSLQEQLKQLMGFARKNNKVLPTVGDRIKATAFIKIGSVTKIKNTSDISFVIEAENERGEKTPIAQSKIISLIPNKWALLETEYKLNNGYIPGDTILLVAALKMTLPWNATVYIDDIKIKEESSDKDRIIKDKKIKPVTLRIREKSFEKNLSFWIKNPSSSSIISINNKDGYYGKSSLMIKNNKQGSGEVYQKINLNKKINTSKLKSLSAGVWVKINDNRKLKNNDVGIVLESEINGKNVIISKGTLPHNCKKNVWIYLMTKSIKQNIKLENFKTIKVKLFSKKQGEVYFDFVQAGEDNTFNGNPEKFVMATYVPFFGGKGNWHNWKWNAKPCGGEYCNPDIILPNGRRKIASVYYPIIGAYDPKDADVIKYQIDLAKAMGIDAFQFNDYGDLHKSYKRTLKTMINLAEKKDFKITILYEPKVHMIGWVPHDSEKEKIEGIIQDLKDILDNYADSKSFLKYQGKPVIQIFNETLYGLKREHWIKIADSLNKAGYDVYFIGSNAGKLNNFDVFKSAFNWYLYKDDLKNCSVKEAYNFCRAINKSTINFVSQKHMKRFPIGIVYPGMNDLKILSWNSGKARVIDITGEDFYKQSWKAILEHEYDFNWILIASWNDWPEGTIIEPDKDRGYKIPIMTQNFIERFKKIKPLNDNLMKQITEKYLKNPDVKKYK